MSDRKVGLLLLCLAFVLVPVAVQASCGLVNGQQVCTDNPNCGYVNGIEVCTVPQNCGYVASSSGAATYTCLGAVASGGEGTAMASSSSGGGSSSSGASYPTDKPVLDATTYIATWLNGSGDTGSTGWFKSAMVWTIQKAVIMYVEFKIDMLKFAWSIFKGIYQSLNISSAIQDAFNSLDSNLAQLLMYVKVPQALNLIIAAFASAFVFRFIPGL